MTENQPFNPALLPAGFADFLPPDAQIEAQGIERLMNVFYAYGYDRVKPPLFEFEDTLLSGSGEVVAEQAFRVVDPESHRTMVIRPDITPQIARLAATRLEQAPRPIRLCYAGPCVMLKGTGSATNREILQAGLELIGPDSAEADAEIIAIASHALQAIGVKNVSFDLTVPLLSKIVVQAAGIEGEDYHSLMRALDRKDGAMVQKRGGSQADVLVALLQAAGNVDHALAMMEKIQLPQEGQYIFDRLKQTIKAISIKNPDIRLTIDPVEFRGWKYHTGICFSVYAQGFHEELGRGGRYLSNNAEPACGLTLRPDFLLKAMSVPALKEKIFIPTGTKADVIQSLQAKGYITLLALSASEGVKEAQKAQCSFIIVNGEVRSL